MLWSRYNTLFRSKKTGRFCYNSLSNSLIELDEKHYALLEGCRQGQDISCAQDNRFFVRLREKHILLEAGEEEGLLLARQCQRQANCFNSSTLGLTICPTLACNFRCPYCFESSQQSGKCMSTETQNRLIDWIKEFTAIKHLSVVWYGGEPLLAFDTICSLTDRFLALGLSYEKVGLITNGYLLDREKIRQLNELKIDSVQITLDGPAEVHDTRRMLAGGDPTFARIMENVAALMDSDYAGLCQIRINVDKNNFESFLGLRTELLERFKGKKLYVYPGHLNILGDQAYDSCCCLNTQEWVDFHLELARRHGMLASAGLHPSYRLDSTCVATTHQGFVLGPEGELYKCWDDVGRPALVVGTIHRQESITNPVLWARYITGVDPFNDPECRNCTVLPICGGGCAHQRLLAKYHGRKEIQYCLPYKTRLIDFLEGYIDSVRTRDICTALLQPGSTPAEPLSWRVISPDPALHAADRAGEVTSQITEDHVAS